MFQGCPGIIKFPLVLRWRCVFGYVWHDNLLACCGNSVVWQCLSLLGLSVGVDVFHLVGVTSSGVAGFLQCWLMLSSMSMSVYSANRPVSATLAGASVKPARS